MTGHPDTIGKYRIDGVLGEGGMGVVYRGWDPALERPVAIKVVHAHLCKGEVGEQFLARFRNEAIAAGRLSHPNIVPVYEYGEHEGAPFIAMAFIEGDELGNRLKAGERLTVESAVHVVTEVLNGLAYCHEHGIVHRDLKPANILVQADGGIKITDFGIARLASSDLTQTGAVMGTMSYMSPEQHLGQVVDHRSDLFSAGVVLYELLTGERPFAGRTNAMVLHNVMNAEVVDPSRINVHVTPALTPVVHRALATAPADRFQSAAEFARALQQALHPHAGAAGATHGAAFPFASGPRGVDAEPIPTRPAGPSPGRAADAPDRSQDEVPTVIAGAPVSPDGTMVVDPDANTVIGEPPDPGAARAAIDDTTMVDQDTDTPPAPARSKTGVLAGAALVVVVTAAAGWFWSTGDPDPAPERAAAAPATAPPPAAPPRVETAAAVASPPAAPADPAPPPAATPVREPVPAAVASPGRRPEDLTISTEAIGGGFTNAMIRVDSTPKGAMFMIDGEPIGITPLELELRPGRYELAIRKARHRAVTHRFEAQRGTRVTIRSNLVEKD